MLLASLLALALVGPPEYLWRALPLDGGGALAALAASPHDPAVVLAGGAGSGFARSGDGGRSWTAVNRGLTAAWQFQVVALACHRTDANVVYAAVGDGPEESGLLASADGGLSWSLRSTRVHCGRAQSPHVLLLEPLNPSHLLAATVDQGVQLSTDYGRTWRSWGLTGSVTALTRTGDGTLYAATSAGVRRRRAGEPGWQNVYDGAALDLAATGRDGRELLLTTDRRVLLSADGGPWQDVTPPKLHVQTGALRLEASPSHPQVGLLWGGERPGEVFLTLDGGHTWQLMVQPGAANVDAGTSWLERDRFATGPLCAAFDPASPRRLWLGDSLAVWATHDGAASWFAGLNGLHTCGVPAFAPGPGEPDRAYVATLGIGAFEVRVNPLFSVPLGGNGLMMTRVSGILARPGLGGTRVLASHGSRVWRQDDPARWVAGAAAPNPLGALRELPDGGVLAESLDGPPLATRDDGGTWQAWTLTNLRAPVLLDLFGRRRAALGVPSGVLLSVDGGGHWERLDAGLPDDLPWSPDDALASLPARGEAGVARLFLAHGGALWRCDDRQGRWERLLARAVGPLAADVALHRLWAAEREPLGLLASDDDGETWTTPGDVPRVPLLRLQADPGRPGRLWVGSQHCGAWVGEPR